MQNRYVGDVGDFGKYGLLRALTVPTIDHPGFSLAVAWYLVPDENHNNDGKHVHYLELDRPELSDCDPVLFVALRRVVRKQRDVSQVARSRILPHRTVFYDRPLTYTSGASLKSRYKARDEWLAAAIAACESADMVFLDPDNGLECSASRYSRLGPKYAYYDDVAAFCGQKRSLIIYHHTGRHGTAQDQVRRRADVLRERFGRTHDIDAILYRRGSSRAFFLLVAHNHRRSVQRRVDGFLHAAWSRHFDRCSLTR
jgi:hypothetical protein